MTYFHIALVGLLAFHLVRWLRRRYVTRRQPTRAERLRDAAWSLWITPTIMFGPFLVLPLLMDFRSALELVFEAWQGFLFFFALPYLAGLFSWIQARRLERRT